MASTVSLRLTFAPIDRRRQRGNFKVSFVVDAQLFTPLLLLHRGPSEDCSEATIQRWLKETSTLAYVKASRHPPQSNRNEPS